MAQGALPAAFAWPAAVGDMATGLAAPFVAWELARGRGRRLAVGFNVFGLADLIDAATLGVPARAGPFRGRADHRDPRLPLALVPPPWPFLWRSPSTSCRSASCRPAPAARIIARP